MRRDLLIGLALAALTLGVYWPVRSHDFIFYDDPQFIIENQEIQRGLTWKTVEYAFSQPVAGNWHPITTLSHALDCELFGVNSGAHHLTNVVFHAANAALLFFLLQCLFCGKAKRALTGLERRTTEEPEASTDTIQLTCVSVAVALIFALHPLRVESVVWISERKDVLSGFFFLLTLWLYAGYCRKAARVEAGKTQMLRDGGGLYMAAVGTFALGLMSKPMLVSVPLVLILLDFWPLGRIKIENPKSQIPNLIRATLDKIPFLVLSLIDCWITLSVQKSAGAMQTVSQATSSERLGNAITSYVRYLGKMFWPVDLAIVYPHPARHYHLSDQWPLWEITAAALLLLLISAFCWLEVQRRPYLAVGWLWFVVMLVPVIGLVQVGEQAMADRYTYLPLIGPVLSLALWMNELKLGNQFTLGLLMVGLVAGLVLSTRHQLAYWKNTVTLFEHAISVTADNPSAQFAVGVGLENEGDLSKAMVRYRVATAIDPYYGKAYYNLGQLLRKSGWWQAAAAAYLNAARCNPNDLATELNLASVLAHLGRTREALERFDLALRLDPNSIEGLNNLAWLLSTSPDAGVRDGARAVQLAEKACSLTGSRMPVLLGTLAAAYAEAGRFSDALQAAEQACARANEMGDLATVTKNKELLEVYRKNQPYRDPGAFLNKK